MLYPCDDIRSIELKVGLDVGYGLDLAGGRGDGIDAWLFPKSFCR